MRNRHISIEANNHICCYVNRLMVNKRIMSTKPRYDSSDLSHNMIYTNYTTSHLPTTMDLVIKDEYPCFTNLPSTSDTVDTIYTITEIKSEPNDTNISCHVQPEYLEFKDVSVNEESENPDEEEERSMQDGETVLYDNQFDSNTIIKEEITIECEPDVDALEVTKSNPSNDQIPENHKTTQFSKRRKKVYKNWQKDTVFTVAADAVDVVKNEQIWTKYTTNRTDKWSKVIYRCRIVKSRGQQCHAGVYLLYSHTDPSVTLFRSTNRHTCESIESKRKPYVRCKNKLIKLSIENGVPIKIELEEKLNNESNQTKTGESQETLKRRKKIVKNWQNEKIFEFEAEAEAAVKYEQTWAKYTTNKTDKGNKVIYRCRNVKSRGQQCHAGVYLLYAADGNVTLYRSANLHTCDNIDSKRKPYVRCKSKIKIKIESEQGNNDENLKKLRRRKKVVKNWQKEKTFELEAGALEAVRKEQTWTKYTTNKTDKGSKVIYRCRNVKSKGQQCDAGVYLLYATDSTVTLYRSANKHTCDIIESKSKSTLSEVAKSIIKTEYEKGIKPKQILGIVIGKGFATTKQIQINNYLAQLRRDAFQSTALISNDFVNKCSEQQTLWTESSDVPHLWTSYKTPNMLS